ncbi:hypothetical protein IW148_001165 [Coemansia sp. RSA 1199]|nr:hypothetical protein IW148_001165 [Coemansia sp. RSA 1199]
MEEVKRAFSSVSAGQDISEWRNNMFEGTSMKCSRMFLRDGYNTPVDESGTFKNYIGQTLFAYISFEDCVCADLTINNAPHPGFEEWPVVVTQN